MDKTSISADTQSVETVEAVVEQAEAPRGKHAAPSPENEQPALTNAMKNGYKLLGTFDAFCERHGIEYFAIADTLIAAVVYNDYFEEPQFFEVGMLRDQYLRLEAAFEAIENTPESQLAKVDKELVLDGWLDEDKTARQLIPTVSLKTAPFVTSGGKLIFDENHLPMQATMSIHVSVFDAVPDDYDFSRVLYFRVKRLCDKYRSATYTGKQGLSNQIWKLAGSYNDSKHDDVVRLLDTRSKPVPLTEIFPLKRVKFGPVSLLAPHITTTWVVEDQDSELEQVKYLQSDALKISKEIDRICRLLGIGYFICGGTMLGMVRHGGFIPWDDDMDIGMLRTDYEVFLELAPEVIGDEFFLQTRQSDPNIPYLFSKVRLRDTEYITKYNEFRDFDKGICVDIFPFDKAPVGTPAMKRMLAIAQERSHAHNIVANRQVPTDGLPHRKARNPKELFFRAVMTARHQRYWHQSLARTQEAYHEAVTVYNDDPSINYVASYVPTFTCISLDDLLPYQDVEFEGVTLMAPKHPETFLRMQYGDFMELPMPHQQRGHGLLRWKGTEHSSDEFNGDAADSSAENSTASGD